LAVKADHLFGELESLAGRYVEAKAALAAATAVHVDGGDTMGRGYMAVSSALVELRAGDPDGARAVLEAVHGDLAEIGERSIRSSITALLARALAATGRPEAALREADTAEALCPSDLFTVIHVELARVAALRALGDLEAADASTRRALAAVVQTDMLLDHAEILLDRAEVMHERHRVAEAREALAQADVLARAKKSAVLDARVAATRARITGARADSP
jgi:tetratricopeptide (TPR) repeat protein